jgi:hypothetical protein
MKVFLRSASVFVGLANIYVLMLIGGGPTIPDRIKVGPMLFLLLFCAVGGGLLAAEIVLRTGRSALEGEFLPRYAIMMGTMSLGGAVFGALYALGVSFGGSLSLIEWVFVAFGGMIVGAVVGGMLGVVEGLLLALPLAAILGLFRNGH